MNRLGRQSAQARFWDWFQRNSERLLHFEAEQEALFAELSAELMRVHKGLTFELGPLQDGQREFILSADGIRKVLPVVQVLVDAAPPLPGWKILAFRQRKPLDLTIRLGGSELGADDIWFESQPEGQHTGLRLYIRGLGEANRRDLLQLAFIFLDCALGEYDVATRVGSIEFHPLPPDPAARGLRPLLEVRELFI
jgi:hypothetical protein